MAAARAAGVAGVVVVAAVVAISILQPCGRRSWIITKVSLGVTDDGEWAVLGAAIGKVLDARMAIQSYTIRGRGGRGGRNGGGANGADPGAGAGYPPVAAVVLALLPAMKRRLCRQPSTTKLRLTKSSAKLAALRTAYNAAEAKLASAQDDFKKPP